MYKGYYYDVELEIYYLNSRYYHPSLRRFITMDDIDYLDVEVLGNLNLYVYCNNNPVMYYDPSGHAWYNVLWDVLNTIAGTMNPISTLIAIGTIIVAMLNGRWNELYIDLINGCLNPYNQSEEVALKSKVLSFYKGSTVVRQDIIGYCSAFGTIWLNSDNGSDDLKHEYGHSIQERIMGTAYWYKIAIPSVAYYCYDVLVGGSDSDYYSMPWERTADWLGGVKGNRGVGYKQGSLGWGIAENIFGPAVIILYFLLGY